MKLLKNYIQVEVKGELVKKAGKLILPETAQKEDRYNFTYKIINIGEDCKKVKINDTILIKKYRQEENMEVLSTKDKLHLKFICTEDDVIAIL